MENFKIKAITDTVIKHLPVDSKQLSISQKFSWAKDSEIEINSYIFAPENHWQLELTLPVNGVVKWFAYQPDVEILGIVLDKIKKINTEFPQIGVYHRPNDQSNQAFQKLG